MDQLPILDAREACTNAPSTPMIVGPPTILELVLEWEHTMAAWAARILVLSTLAVWQPIVHAAAVRAFNLERIHGHYRDGDFEKVIQELEGFLKSGRKCFRSDSIFLEKHLAVVYAANPATRELGRYHMHKLLEISSAADLLDMFVGEEVDYVFEKVRKEHFLTAVSSSPKRENISPRIASAPSARANTAAVRPAAIVRVPAMPRKVVEKKAIVPVQPPLPPPSSLPPPLASSELTKRETFQELPDMPSRVDAPREVVKASDASWRDAGAWIGGGTALAVVAFTLYFAGSPKETPSKTYVIPATATR